MRSWLLLLVVVAGCESRNGRFCGDGICTDPAYPFCDIDGAIAGSPKTCIAVSCNAGDFAMCRGNDALICSASGNDYDDKACQNGCDMASGGCVGCIADSQCANPTPRCDATTRECRACQADAECASGVCDTDSGACIAENTVAYASPTGADTASCTKTDACSIAHALAITNISVNAVKLATGAYTSSGLTITNKALTIYGTGATILTSGSAPALDITDRSSVRVLGLTIVDTASGGVGVRCSMNNHADMPAVDLVGVTIETTFAAAFGVDCTLSLRQCNLHSSFGDSGGYVVAGKGVTTIDRSIVRGGDGIACLGGSVEISNSVIADQLGPDGALTSRNQVLGQGKIHVTFSTFSNTVVKCLSNTSFCSDGGACIDNSVLFDGVTGAPSDTVTGDGCILNYSIVFPQTTPPPGANNKVGMNPVLRDPAHGDYHLQPTSGALDAADPTSALKVDLDGTARPQGMRSDMGAFEFKR